jgi:hypothetical protein
LGVSNGMLPTALFRTSRELRFEYGASTTHRGREEMNEQPSLVDGSEVGNDDGVPVGVVPCNCRRVGRYGGTQR